MKPVMWICFAALSGLWSLSGAAGAAGDATRTEREGGIIGTGIVGTITELGSIVVNGVRVTFGEDFQAETPFGLRPASALVPGETVVVEAEGEGQTALATRIATYLPVIGPISRNDAGTWQIMGTEIVMDQATMDGQPGEWVAVNGLWQGNRLIATRVDIVPPQQHATIIGTYWGNDDVGFTVGQTKVRNVEISHAQIGDVITVQGVPEENGIKAQTVSIGLFSGPVDTLLVEGFLSAPDASGVYTVHGAGVVAFTDNPGMVPAAPRGLYCIDQNRKAPIRRVDAPYPDANPCAE